jgi:hypothetical protein
LATAENPDEEMKGRMDEEMKGRMLRKQPFAVWYCIYLMACVYDDSIHLNQTGQQIFRGKGVLKHHLHIYIYCILLIFPPSYIPPLPIFSFIFKAVHHRFGAVKVTESTARALERWPGLVAKIIPRSGSHLVI